MASKITFQNLINREKILDKRQLRGEIRREYVKKFLKVSINELLQRVINIMILIDKLKNQLL